LKVRCAITRIAYSKSQVILMLNDDYINCSLELAIKQLMVLSHF